MAWKPALFKVEKRPVKWPNFGSNARKFFDEEGQRYLADSLLKDGQLQDCGAVKDGTGLWGERRCRAAELAGITELSFKIFDETPSPDQIVVVNAAENMHKALLPIEECLAVETLAALRPDLSNQELGGLLHKSASDITRYRTVLRDPNVRKALELNQIGLSVAYMIAKAEKEEARAAGMGMALGGGTREQVEREIQKAMMPTAIIVPEEQVVDRCRLAMSGGITLTVAAKGLTLPKIASWLKEMQDSLKKAMAEGLSLATTCKALADRAKAKPA